MDLLPVVESAVTLLRNGSEVGPDHIVTFEADEGPHVCLADPDQITQVFWNLARNGLEAMPAGGRLDIALRRVERDLVLSVRDEGRGIARDEQRRLFEPLAAAGRPGAGLGLAIVFQIVRAARRRHHGAERGRAGYAVRRAAAAGVGPRPRMSQLPRRVPPGVLAAAVLAALVLATFASALPSSRVLFERDMHAYWYPQRAALRAALAEGRVPLWNPWVGFGAPFLADASSELAYPPTWLLLPLPLPLQFELVTIGHCLLAAAGAAALARRLFGSWLAAVVAGGAYALAGPLVSAASLYHHFAGAAFLPWVLFGARGAAAAPGPTARAGAGGRVGGAGPGRLGRPGADDGGRGARPGGVSPTRHARSRARGPAAAAGPRGRGRALDLRGAVAAHAGARDPRLAGGAGLPHANLLVAPPAIARGSRGAAARLRRGFGSLGARPALREP